MFKMQLVAYLAGLGLEGVLEEAFDHQLPATQATPLDETKTDEALLIGAKEANTKVMQVLVLSFKKPSLVNAIAMSKTIEWPVGKAWKVWKEFHDRFEPDDAISGMTMEDELMKIRIKKTEDPKVLTDRIAAIAVRYGCIISEDEQYKIAIRATKANHSDIISTYETTYEMVHRRKPTTTELLKALHKAYLLSPHASKGGEDADEDDSEPTDVALAQPGAFAKAFNKKCFKCNRKGHMAKDCTSSNNNNNNSNRNTNTNGGGGGGGRFKGNCNHCGKEGHMARDCFTNPESSKYKGGNNKEATAGSVEVLVASVEENKLGVEFFLSSIEHEHQDEQGKNVTDGDESEVKNDEDIRSTEMQAAVERSSIRAARYAEVQAVVLAHQLRQQFTLSDSQMPTLMGFSDAGHTELVTESNVRILDNDDNDSYADMPGLVAREEDSTVVSNEDTLLEESSLADFSHDSTDVT